MEIQKVAQNKDNKENFPRKYYILTGGLAGIFNGLFGGGGGMIVVPMLVFLLKKEPKVSHATAILIILPLSILSGIFYVSFGAFELNIGIPTTIGVITGGVLGALLLSKLSSKKITLIFTLVMAFAGLKLLAF